MTCHGSTQRNRPRSPRTMAWLTVHNVQEIAGALARRFELERRRQRGCYLFVSLTNGAVFLLQDDSPLADDWVLTRTRDFVGFYFAGRVNSMGHKTVFAMPPTIAGLVEDLADHMGF